MENNTNANDNDCPRFRPFACPTQRKIKVKKAKYSTSLDPRGYIPVYEYLVNGQPIMWDRESGTIYTMGVGSHIVLNDPPSHSRCILNYIGYVHFTGIWKSLGNSKADIVKMVDSNPELKVKKIRGGFLKIQGTWIPYEYAYLLCKRTAWVIRTDLVAMFGPRFINDALDPSHPEYGWLLLDPSSNQKNVSVRRNSFNTTMRQQNGGGGARHHHPYKRDFMRNGNHTKLPSNKLASAASNILPRHHQQHHQYHKGGNNKVVSSMSVSRLLNGQASDADSSSSSVSDQEEQLVRKAFNTADSPNTTPSPTFRVIPTFDYHNKWATTTTIETSAAAASSATTRLLPPIYTNTTNHTTNDQQQQPPSYVMKRSDSEPHITPIFSSSSPTWSPISPVASEVSTTSSSSEASTTSDHHTGVGYAKDIIDTINATILLQRLSQDDGARPFKPMHPDLIPSKVMIGNQEFRICWDN